MDLGQEIDALYAKRAARLTLDKEVKKLKEEEAVIREELIKKLQAAGLQRASGAMATAGIKATVKPIVKDWDEIYAYIYRNHRWDLLHQRLSTTAWEDMLNEGELLPGTESFTDLDISLTKASR